MALSQLGGWMTDVRALQALAEYLQEDTENRSAALARALHDDLA
jgi:hypothetical protein